nr:hypothetical protein [Chitinophagaceae bacterium]
TAGGVPAASLYIQKKGNKYELTIQTQTAENIRIVDNEKIIYREGDPVAEDVLLRIFGKKGPIEPEYTLNTNN